METYLKFTVPTFNSCIVHHLDPDKTQEIVQRFNQLMSIDQDQEDILRLESIHESIQAISDVLHLQINYVISHKKHIQAALLMLSLSIEEGVISQKKSLRDHSRTQKLNFFQETIQFLNRVLLQEETIQKGIGFHISKKDDEKIIVEKAKINQKSFYQQLKSELNGVTQKELVAGGKTYNLEKKVFKERISEFQRKKFLMKLSEIKNHWYDIQEEKRKILEQYQLAEEKGFFVSEKISAQFTYQVERLKRVVQQESERMMFFENEFETIVGQALSLLDIQEKSCSFQRANQQFLEQQDENK
ncbi:MAG: hypothetical protein ACI86H_002716 [bacterium]|jgi:hypothetical protein